MRIPTICKALLLSTAYVTLAADPAWTQVKGPATAHVLQYRIMSTLKGPVIEFRNAGAERAHFHFRFVPHQNQAPGKGVFNGRVHLSPGGPTAWLRLPVVPGVSAMELAAAEVHVFRLRLGLADAGATEPDAP